MARSDKISHRRLLKPQAKVVCSADSGRNRARNNATLKGSPVNRVLYVIILFILFASLLLCGCTTSSEVVATIDDDVITITQVRARIKDYDEQTLFTNKEDSKTQARRSNSRAALTQLINERLLLIEACNRGFLTDADRTNKAKCKQAIRKVLIKLGKQVQFPSYQEAFTYYQQHRDEFAHQTRYQLEHLLFKSEEQAWKLKEKIETGTLSIAEARRQTSGDHMLPNSVNQHLLTVDEMPMEVAAILPDLKINQLSSPVATTYGYHLVMITKIIPAGTTPFPEVENKIKDLLFAKRLKLNYQRWIEQSRKQHTIKIYSKHLNRL